LDRLRPGVRFGARVGLLGLLTCVCVAPAVTSAGADGWRGSASSGDTASVQGRVVKFARNGYEPDGDPVDRVIIAAGLRDWRRAGRALPATTLVLSTYLENFQSANVPILPDLLRQDVTATSLAGFMQGKAALVDGAGRVRYQGGVLAEVFFDNTVHVVTDMYPKGLPASVPSLRLSGIFTLHKGSLSLDGALRASRTFSSGEVAALRVRYPRAVSWQAVVGSLRVRYPKMIDTMGTTQLPPLAPSPQPPAQAASRQRQAPLASSPPRTSKTNTNASRQPSRAGMLAIFVPSAALVAFLVYAGLRVRAVWRRRAGAGTGRRAT